MIVSIIKVGLAVGAIAIIAKATAKAAEVVLTKTTIKTFDLTIKHLEKKLSETTNEQEIAKLLEEISIAKTFQDRLK